jgi:protein O-GlcNAc transferase
MLTVAQALTLAVQQHQAGQLQQAEQLYRAILQVEPQQVDALHLLGVLADQVGQHERASTYIRQALRLKPDFAEAHYNLGGALKAQGKLDEARACYEQALRLKPHYPEAYNNLGTALEEQGQRAKALACYQQAVRLKPEYAEAHYNLGNFLYEQGQLAQAQAYLQQALRLKPDHAKARVNLGDVLQDQGKLAEAQACYQQALCVEPDFAEAHNNLGTVLQGQGQLDEALACYQQARRLQPDWTRVHSNLLLVLHYRTGVTLKELAEAHAEYERQHAAQLRSSWRPHPNDRAPQRPLRLGFVSADLGRHPIGYFLIRVLEHLDPQQADLVCYSNRLLHDDLTRRFQAAASTWRDVAGWSDDRLAEQIRTDQIDLLFDMSGHSARNRLGVFARKPAPIQLTWGGMGTTGLQAMDYILADRHEIPPEAEAYYCERVLCLPDGFFCYDPPPDAPPVSALPALTSGQVTFGSFNNPAKITRAVIAVWAQILQRVPRSRLVLKYRGWDDPALTRRVREQFARHGVDPARVECRGWSPHGEMLAEYHGIDLALDPFPYSGCTTTCAALWMGVPVLTWPGETFTSRHSLTHLSNVGLTETIARSLEEYVALAESLAGDLPRLAGLRARLREQMAASPLCDGKRFATNLMRLLRGVWEQWLAQNAG